MGDDGYASPESGRRRRKAGPEFPRSSEPSTWWPYIGAGLVGIVLLGMIAFGFAAGIKYLDNRDTAGSQWTNVMTSCVPLNHTASYDDSHDSSDILSTATLEVARTHDVVTVTIAFSIEEYVNFANGENDYWMYIDSRCIPPSESFAPCEYDPCPDPDSNPSSRLIGNDVAQLPIFGSVFAMTGAAVVAAPTAASEYATQADYNGMRMYGIEFNMPTEYGNDSSLERVTFTLTYTTNSSASWKIPDFCTGGPCPIGTL